MINKEIFDKDLQELAVFGRVISHPARLAILKFLAESKTCITGDINDHLPLSRTTVSQHLKELKQIGLIHGKSDGVSVKYCLSSQNLNYYHEQFERFFAEIEKI